MDSMLARGKSADEIQNALADLRRRRGGDLSGRPLLADEIKDKIPGGWGDGEPTRKGGGWRWTDPGNEGNGVRVDAGNPNNPNPSQQVDHVIVRSDGVVIGRDGEPIDGSIKNDPVNAHIPISEYKNWKTWNRP